MTSPNLKFEGVNSVLVTIPRILRFLPASNCEAPYFYYGMPKGNKMTAS